MKIFYGIERLKNKVLCNCLWAVKSDDTGLANINVFNQFCDHRLACSIRSDGWWGESQ